jgi:CRP-like cAMP-binding protein
MFSAACRFAATDTGNQLLATLPRDAWCGLEPDLVHVDLAQGQTLQDAGAASRYVYFPGTAVVSLVSGLRDGCMAEVALVGHEGMVGISAFVGAQSRRSVTASIHAL